MTDDIFIYSSTSFEAVEEVKAKRKLYHSDIPVGAPCNHETCIIRSRRARVVQLIANEIKMKDRGSGNANDQKVRKSNKRKRSIRDEAVNPSCEIERGTKKISENVQRDVTLNHHTSNVTVNASVSIPDGPSQQQKFPNYQYILAPMVGASELPFRFLCRKYGAQLCYTPMMSSQSFATSTEYRKEYFGTVNSNRVHYADHPIYAHVHANTVHDFVAAAQQALAMNCDGIDLNLGCPQRTAYIGHYGSYLCTSDAQTHRHISDMLTAAAQAVQHKIPITAKIRLLHPTDPKLTLDLCHTLYNNGKGASLIAIHARPRASWERTGPSARDGPANLHQVTSIVQATRHVETSIHEECHQAQIPLRIVTNGNTTTYDDVVKNLQITMADGIMSAEGLLDNPALYLPRFCNDIHCNKCSDSSISKNDNDKTYVNVWTLKEEFRYIYKNYKPYQESGSSVANVGRSSDHDYEITLGKIQSIEGKMHKVEQKLQCLQKKQASSLLLDQKTQLKCERYKTKRQKLQKKLLKLQIRSDNVADPSVDIAPGRIIHEGITHSTTYDSITIDPHIERRAITIQSLQEIAADKVQLGMEYLDWATIYRTTIRTVVFHIRRMCKAELVQYQLLQPCLQATNIDSIRDILNRVIQYRTNPDTFMYDSQRAQQEKEALARQKYEEGKRKAFEERMIRKAKREKKEDLFYYLNVGAELPTPEQMKYYRTLDRETLIPIWKENHSQHCVSYHLDRDKCKRGRACAFLHEDTMSKMSLQERDECAG